MIKNMAQVCMTEAELARDLHAVLDRVQSGAEVIVERNAQPVAILRAAEPRRRKLSEIAAALAEHSTATIDPDFAKDVNDFDEANSRSTLTLNVVR